MTTQEYMDERSKHARSYDKEDLCKLAALLSEEALEFVVRSGKLKFKEDYRLVASDELAERALLDL